MTRWSATAGLALGGLGATTALVIASARWSPPLPPSGPPGGRGTVSVAVQAHPTFLVPAADLSIEARPRFRAGQALARQPWIKAPSSTDARDGLGPLYDARSCLACHERGGRGVVAAEDGPLSRATVVRVSVPGEDRRHGARPEPTYGDQLQRRSVDVAYAVGAGEGDMPPEAEVEVQWLRSEVRYADGQTVTLRRPKVAVRPGYGRLEPEARIGLRHAPVLYGLGLLDTIAAEDIAAGADPGDADEDGISGRVNRVWDVERRAAVVGRFGWKANQPSLRQQVAAAFANDIGITSPVFPRPTCTSVQAACRASPHGAPPGQTEISESLLALVVEFTRAIGVPARRKPEHPAVVAGQRLFMAYGCDGCHRPRWRTADDPRRPYLSGQEIWPYTDLLLHDMGEALSDDRPDFEADGRQWRTPPLWGAGLARAVHRDVGFLHDGRARTIEEAILWHGGEAAPSRQRFVRASSTDRRALLAFVRSL